MADQGFSPGHSFISCVRQVYGEEKTPILTGSPVRRHPQGSYTYPGRFSNRGFRCPIFSVHLLVSETQLSVRRLLPILFA